MWSLQHNGRGEITISIHAPHAPTLQGLCTPTYGRLTDFLRLGPGWLALGIRQGTERLPKCQNSGHTTSCYMVTLELKFINLNSRFKQFKGNPLPSLPVPESQSHKFDFASLTLHLPQWKWLQVRQTRVFGGMATVQLETSFSIWWLHGLVFYEKGLDEKQYFLHNYFGESIDKHEAIPDGCPIDATKINHPQDGGMCPSKRKWVWVAQIWNEWKMNASLSRMKL